MKYSGQSFLDALPSHPIFHLGTAENNAWKHDQARRLKKPFPSSPILKPSSSSSNSNASRALSTDTNINDHAKEGDFWPDPTSRARDCIPKTCLATAGTRDDLYVAVGRHVRSLNLRETKAAWTEAWKKSVKDNKVDELSQVDEEEAKEWISNVEYKILIAENATFPIRQLSVNPTGRILAVAGDQDVAVVLLPRTTSSYSAGTGRRRVQCKSFVVGAFNHSTGVNNYVVQIGWHPLGDGGQHLMVLTTDGILRIYDIANCYNEPEQAIPLTPSATVNSGFSRGYSAADEEEVAAFAIGSPSISAEKQVSLGWLALTVYSLTKGGDIYAVCPVLPKRCILNSDYLNSLLDTTEAKIQDVDGSPSASLQRHSLNHQRQWLKKLKKNSSPCEDNYASSSVNGESELSSMLRSTIDHAMSPPALQGPFLLQPRPADFIRTESEADLPVDATGIAMLETDPCRTLVVGFEDGKVDVYLEVETIEALWPKPVNSVHQRQVSELPTLAVYESINLAVPCRGPLTLTTDPLYPDTFYVHHSAGLQAVVVKGCADLLKRMYTSDDQEDWSEIAERSETSQARWIVSTMPLKNSESTPVIGLVILDDPLLGYNLLLLTSAFQAVNVELAMRRLTDESPKKYTTAETEARDLAHESLSNKLRLPSPLFRPSDALESSFPKQPRIAAGTKGKEISMDEEGLRYLGKIVEKTRQEAREVGRAGEQAAKRLQLQSEMLSFHVEQLLEAQANTEKQEQIFKEQHDRLLTVAGRQRRLTARADTILQMLMDRHQPTLSVYEEKWISEVRQAEIKIRGTESTNRQEEVRTGDLMGYRRGISRGPSPATNYKAKVKEIRNQMLALKNELDYQTARRPPSVQQIPNCSKRLSNFQLQRIMSAISKETALLDRTKSQIDTLCKRMQSLGVNV